MQFDISVIFGFAVFWKLINSPTIRFKVQNWWNQIGGTTCVFIVTLFSVTSAAQAPGYMGKRATVGYAFNFSPAFVYTSASGGKLNTIHELYFDYAVSKKWQIGICGRFYRTIYNNEQSLSNSDRPEDHYSISGTSIALNFKYYRGNYLAPWGRYFMMSPILNIATTTHDPYMHIKAQVTTFPVHDTLYTDFGPAKQKFYHPDLMIGWGRTRIIADRVSIDYGLNLQMFAMLSVVIDAFNSDVVAVGYDNYIRITQAYRVHGINRTNFFVKVGYLF